MWKKCEYCGDLFIQNERGRPRKYCKKCSPIVQQIKLLELNSRRKKNYPPRRCIICNLSYKPRTKRQVYCRKKKCQLKGIYLAIERQRQRREQAKVEGAGTEAGTGV